MAFSAAESGFLGGISSRSTRPQSSLSARLPATSTAPLSPPVKAAARLVRSNPPFCSWALWQPRQRRAKSGATSRSNDSAAPPFPASPATASAAQARLAQGPIPLAGNPRTTVINKRRANFIVAGSSQTGARVDATGGRKLYRNIGPRGPSSRLACESGARAGCRPPANGPKKSPPHLGEEGYRYLVSSAASRKPTKGGGPPQGPIALARLPPDPVRRPKGVCTPRPGRPSLAVDPLGQPRPAARRAPLTATNQVDLALTALPESISISEYRPQGRTWSLEVRSYCGPIEAGYP